MLINIKPISVNESWKGRRYKTDKYKKWRKDIQLLLPNKNIPEGKLSIEITFGFSSASSDIDNALKSTLDALNDKYDVNDNRYYRLIVTKSIVPKGKEFIKLEINTFENT